MTALLSCSARKLRAGLIVVLTMLAILCPQTLPAQNNWQQQQMWQQQQRQMEAQRQQQRQMEMQRQQQQRQQQIQMQQQQMRQQQAMQQRQMQQQQQRTQWGQRPQQGTSNSQRTVQPWRPNQSTGQRTWQGQSGTQRTFQPQRPNQATGQRQTTQQRTFTPQRTGTTRSNQAAAQRRDVFNAQRGVTVRLAPNRTATVLVTRSPNRTEIAQGFRGRYSGDRAVVTVRGKTFTVPRSMVNNRVVGAPTRVTFARKPAAAGGGGGNGRPPRRWVLSGGGGSSGGNGSSSGGSGSGDRPPPKVHPDVLIGAESAVIDTRKLTHYALNPEHPEGRNKARVFESALGFNASNADVLLSQIKDGVRVHAGIPGKEDQFGRRFTVDIPVNGPKGSGIVRTGWIYKAGSSSPELTTLFVK